MRGRGSWANVGAHKAGCQHLERGLQDLALGRLQLHSGGGGGGSGGGCGRRRRGPRSVRGGRHRGSRRSLHLLGQHCGGSVARALSGLDRGGRGAVRARQHRGRCIGHPLNHAAHKRGAVDAENARLGAQARATRREEDAQTEGRRDDEACVSA